MHSHAARRLTISTWSRDSHLILTVRTSLISKPATLTNSIEDMLSTPFVRKRRLSLLLLACAALLLLIVVVTSSSRSSSGSFTSLFSFGRHHGDAEIEYTRNGVKVTPVPESPFAPPVKTQFAWAKYHDARHDEPGAGHHQQDRPVDSIDDRHPGAVFDPRALNFTIVVLVYKSPKSLTALLQSLHRSGIIFHAQLEEIVVYFQAMDAQHDVQVVTGALEEWPTGHFRGMVRVTGRPENLPVAKATFAALQEVKTKLVLYLECDRPALSYPVAPADEAALAALEEQVRAAAERRAHNDADHQPHPLDQPVMQRHQHHHHHHHGPALSAADEKRRLSLKYPALGILDTAIRTLASRQADVFRLQVYANADLARGATPELQTKHYGAGPHFEKCGRAPYLSSKECLDAKQRGDRSLYNAYCKHWAKLLKFTPRGHQDMCDATCFMRWHDMVAVAAGASDPGAAPLDVAAMSPAQRAARMAELGVNATLVEALTQLAKEKMLRRTRLLDGEAGQVLCTDSELCNWTNQPTMYMLDWYTSSIQEPCLKNAKGCVGVPGRRSAVLQEVFFVKSRRDWAERKHKICVHRRGLFVHQELDG
jgi:hypothetical protein